MNRLFSVTGALVVCLLLSANPSFAQSSPQELVAGVLKGFEKSDRQALSSYLIADADIKTYVWPNMPAALTENLKVDKFTSMQVQSNNAGLDEDLKNYGGHKLELVKVDLGETKKSTKAYKLYGAPSITVKDQDGKEKTIRLIGGILEKDGTFKVTTYYVSPALK